MPWILAWGFADTEEGRCDFPDRGQALDFVKTNWDPAEDIVSDLRETGTWDEHVNGVGNLWMHLTEAVASPVS